MNRAAPPVLISAGTLVGNSDSRDFHAELLQSVSQAWNRLKESTRVARAFPYDVKNMHG